MKLKEMRKKRGLSGYEVAEILKISPQYYYEIEGVKVDELLGRGEPGIAIAPSFEGVSRSAGAGSSRGGSGRTVRGARRSAVRG